ncbi:MAG: sulfotransferase family 2 domain-containing protein [Saprospiraceae bacterium]|nr:sulfotransferase family 2 domain-containing protein [Saprospiraceae bacterium]
MINARLRKFFGIQEPHRLELISIHIPKTAGTSFYAILQDIYGKSHSIEVKREQARANAGKFQRFLLPEHLVLHGHFHFEEVRNLFDPSRVRLVTWLREPVNRVISNYYFFNRKVNEDPNHSEWHRRDEPLEVYAHYEENRNRMTKFLDGIALEDLFFFGIQEHFEEDVALLRKKMGWPDVQIRSENTNQAYQSQFPPVSADLKEQIRAWNVSDVQLYERALELRRMEDGPE